MTPVEEPEESTEDTEPVEAAEPDGEELAELEPVAESTNGAPARPATRSSDRSIARADPMAAYMAEVQRHPVLSREEEHALAVRYRETGDVESAYRLVASNLRLVVKIAHEYRDGPRRKHDWHSGWVAEAVEFLAAPRTDR